MTPTAPTPPESSAPDSQPAAPPPRSRWRTPALIIGALVVLAAAGAAGYLLMRPRATPVVARTPAPTPALGTLLYAYQEGKTTTVRELDLKTQVSKDLFSFPAQMAVQDDGLGYADQLPNVDYG